VSSTSDYAEQLRSADLRVTRPRVAVLEAVHALPHADTETIYSSVREALPDVSRQAVYDVLNALTTVGLIRRIQPLGSVARYESRVGDNHHHLVCRSCGATVEVEGPAVERWTSAIAAEHGFSELSHTLEVVGTCADCRRD
jgi:Fur family ferric uptake transcriptional regulator